MTIIDSIILGVVEGITEFLPVSSTAHLILTAKLLGIKEDDYLKAYETIIQLGAILAILFIYKERLTKSLSLWIKLSIAFVPTGFAGLFFYSYIKEFFTPSATVWFMVGAGIAFILIEKLHNEKEHHIEDPEHTSYLKSFLIGVFQTIALLPGISRSGATIIGGMLLGMKRKAAVEFSFLLAIPTMFAATGYEVYKGYESFVFDSMLTLAVGFVTSFIFSYFAIKWFLDFIGKYDFIPFGIYLIVSGLGFYWVIL